MKCIKCGHEETRVLDSRAPEDAAAIRRRRECVKCEYRFSTYERVEILNITVLKNGGKEEPYMKEKVISGLERALEKRKISHERLVQTMGSIERDIQVKSKNDRISSRDIGEIVMKYLKKLDKVAYIRFASVYRDFQDAETFCEEVSRLLKHSHS